MLFVSVVSVECLVLSVTSVLCKEVKNSLKLFAAISGSKMGFPSLSFIKLVTVLADLPVMSLRVCQGCFGLAALLTELE